MSGLFTPKSPKIVQPDNSAANLKSTAQAAAQTAAAAAAAEKRRRMVETALRGSTILTAGDGIPGDASVARVRGKTLLGQ